MKKIEGKPKAVAEQVVEKMIEGEPRRYKMNLHKGKLTKKQRDYNRFVDATWHIHF